MSKTTFKRIWFALSIILLLALLSGCDRLTDQSGLDDDHQTSIGEEDTQMKIDPSHQVGDRPDIDKNLPADLQTATLALG